MLSRNTCIWQFNTLPLPLHTLLIHTWAIKSPCALCINRWSDPEEYYKHDQQYLINTHRRSVRPTWVFTLWALVVAWGRFLDSLRSLTVLLLGPWSALDDDSVWPDFSMSVASSRTEITLETFSIFPSRPVQGHLEVRSWTGDNTWTASDLGTQGRTCSYVMTTCMLIRSLD